MGPLELCCQVALFNSFISTGFFFPLSNTYQEAHCSNIQKFLFILVIILATSYYSKLNKGVCAAHTFLKTHCLCIPLHCRRSKGLHTVMKSTLFHISPGKNNRLFFFSPYVVLNFPLMILSTCILWFSEILHNLLLSSPEFP